MSLRETSLSGRDVVEIAVDPGEVAFAIDVRSEEVEPAWHDARAVAGNVGLWPVAITFWSGSAGSLAARLEEENPFSRFYFEEAPGAADVSPKALLERASEVDVDAFLRRKSAEVQQWFDLDTAIEEAVVMSERRWGIAPDPEVLRTGLDEGDEIGTAVQLEWRLLEWEDAHGFVPDVDRARPRWFMPDDAALLFLPVRSGWDTLAYLNWFGTSDFGAEHYIALGRRWEEQYGAELVSHYGTMLQCIVRNPPSGLPQSWRRAREHDLAGPSTLGLTGIPLRDYARALVGHDRWFLHERP